MPIGKDELQLLVKLKNEASPQLKKLSGDLKKFGAVAGATAGDVKNLNASMGLLTKIGIAGLAAGLTGLAVKMGMTAARVQELTLAAHVMGARMGKSKEEIDSTISSVAKLNLTTSAATRFVLELTRAEVDLAEATKLARGAQDLAVAAGMSSSEAIERITEVIQTGIPWQLRQLGIVRNLNEVYEDYANKIDKTSQELTRVEKKQAIVNAIKEEAAKVEGLYIRSLDSASKAARSLSDRMKMLEEDIGVLFLGALNLIIPALNRTATAFRNWVLEHKQQIADLGQRIAQFLKGVGYIASGVINVLGAVLGQFINTVVTSANLLKNAITLNWEGIKDTYREGVDRTQALSEQLGAGIKKVGIGFKTFFEEVKQGTFALPKAMEKSTNEMVKNTSKALQQMREAIEKENRDFKQRMEDRTKDFEDSLKDLVLAHKEKVKDLEKDIKEENADFEEALKERKDSFDKAMADLELRHEKKVLRISEQIEKEKEKINDSIDKISDKYDLFFRQLRLSEQTRLAHLKSQLDKEVAKGKFANSEKIKTIKRMLKDEKKAFAQNREELEKLRGDEVEEVKNNHQEKLDNLKAELEEEKREVSQARLEKETEYEKETAKLVTEHNKRLKALQDELNIEKEIQKRHAEDFAKFKDAVVEDDIARLKRKFAEERAIMEREHRDRLNDIVRRAKEERIAREREQAIADSRRQQSINRQIQQTRKEVQRTQRVIQQSFRKPSLVRELTPSPISAPSAQPRSGTSFWGTIGNWASGVISGIKSGLSKLWPFQEGGIVTKPTAALIGEAGPEMILPLTNKRRMNELLGQVGQNVQINMPITQVSSEIDLDILLERMMWKLNKEGLIGGV